MNNLLKPVEYAQKFGISRQAVYAKIKKGILKAKNIEGKLYVIMDEESTEKKVEEEKKEVSTKTLHPVSSTKIETISKDVSKIKKYKALLKAKEETIGVLKGTVKELKKSNKQISSTLKSEISLLKEAFHEMRTIYVAQIEQKKEPKKTKKEELQEEIIEIEIEKWIGITKFLKKHNITQKKEEEKVLKRLNKAYKKGDERLIKIEDKLKLNANKKYKDILKK